MSRVNWPVAVMAVVMLMAGVVVGNALRTGASGVAAQEAGTAFFTAAARP